MGLPAGFGGYLPGPGYPNPVIRSASRKRGNCSDIRVYQTLSTLCTRWITRLLRHDTIWNAILTCDREKSAWSTALKSGEITPRNHVWAQTDHDYVSMSAIYTCWVKISDASKLYETWYVTLAWTNVTSSTKPEVHIVLQRHRTSHGQSASHQ